MTEYFEIRANQWTRQMEWRILENNYKFNNKSDGFGIGPEDKDWMLCAKYITSSTLHFSL